MSKSREGHLGLNKVPVLIIAFNRPENLAECLDSLLLERCSKIYVSIDGPRSEIDKIKQSEMRAQLDAFAKKNNVNLKIRHGLENLGCGQGVITSIDWFFTFESAGLILEDDLLIKPEFFNFLDSVLAVESLSNLAVSAYAPFQIDDSGKPYWKSRYLFISGWFLSGDLWRSGSENLTGSKLPIIRSSDGLYRSLNESLFWWSARMKVLLGFTDTWDCLFFEHFWQKSYSCAVPTMTFITNNGFDENGTHTQNLNDDLASKFMKSKIQVSASVNLDRVIKESYFQIGLRHFITPIVSLIVKVITQSLSPDKEVTIQRQKIKKLSDRSYK